MESRIYLIRHGKTIANEQRLYCGATDLPLSEGGAEEIRLFKSEGIYPAAELFFTSGLLRTTQTLDIIYGGVNKKAIPEISEYRFGEFEMQSYEDLKEREDYQAWITDETGDIKCPGGESKNRFNKRVTDGFNNILSQAGGSPAFVSCHGGAIACIMERLCPGAQNFYEWQPKPGRGYALIFDDSGRLHIYNKI